MVLFSFNSSFTAAQIEKDRCPIPGRGRDFLLNHDAHKYHKVYPVTYSKSVGV
jgi:hypothetical protein